MFEQSSCLLCVSISCRNKSLPHPGQRIIWVKSLRLVECFIGELSILIVEVEQS